MDDGKSTKVRTDLDTPAGYNGSNGPGGALKMPVKHYPESNKGLHKGSTSIDSPANKGK